MKKCKRTICLLLIMLMAFMLQGCSIDDFSVSALTTPTTSHEIVKDKYVGNKIEITLKAEMEEKYEWYIYPLDNFDRTGEKLKKGLLNKTYTWNYAYLINAENDFTFYLLLVKDGDMETCRAFPYQVHVKDSGASVVEGKAFTLKGDTALYDEITSNLTLTTSY